MSLTKNLISLACFLLFSVFSFAQNSILIYSTEEDYLMGKIQKTLKDLRNAESNNLLFKEVTNLNQIASNFDSEVALRLVINNYSDLNLEENDSTEKVNQILIDNLLKNDYFLMIKTNLIYDVIEYQFYLNKVIKDKSSSKKFALASNPLAFIASENILLNPKDQNKYIELTKAVKRLFPEVNTPPAAVISVNDSIKTNQTIYYHSLHDTLFLESKYSRDVDTETEYWEYHWRQLDTSGNLNVSGSQLSDFISKGFSAFATFRNEGTYKYGLKIFDGSSYSKEATLTVIVLKPPQLFLPRKKIVNHARSYIFGEKKDAKDNKETVFINGYRDWDLIVRKISFDESDTITILNKYAELRKKYDQELYDHINGKLVENDRGPNQLVFPDKPDSIPILEKFISNPNRIKISYEKSSVPEGLIFSFPHDDNILKSGTLELYLQKNGLKSEPKHLKIKNKTFSPVTFEYERNFTPWIIENTVGSQKDSLPNQMVGEHVFRINANIFFRLERDAVINSSLKRRIYADIGIGFIPNSSKTLNLIDSIVFNPLFDISNSLYFPFIPMVETPKNVGIGIKIQHSLKVYIGSDNLESSKPGTNQIKPFLSYHLRGGISIHFRENIPIDLTFYFFGDHFPINNNKLNFKFKRIKDKNGFGLSLKLHL